MLESLFPNWSNPATIAAIVGLRVGFNGCLTAIVASASGVRTLVTGVAAGLTILSAVIMVLALRPGFLGRPASFVELFAQFVLLLVGTFAVSQNPSSPRVAAAAIVLVCATALWLVTVPIYGEAFFAP